MLAVVNFMKFKEPKYFVVLKKEYRPIPTILEADWETELSFGQRGETFDCVRYKRSSGTMYSKNSCSWKKFENRNEAIDFYNELLEYQNKIDDLSKQIRSEIDLMHGHFNYH
jgi:hypothetical protein